MAKDKSEADIAAKKEKKDKKRKSSEAFDFPATTDEQLSATKKEKKSKKDRKSSDGVEIVAPDAGKADTGEEDKKAEEGVKLEIPLSALVPFANPLCDEKAQKKVLKGVKKAAKHKALKRGVKECVKTIRKSPTSSLTAPPPGLVVLAADISPMDVISHIPVLCEDHNIPYVYVPSRAELGAAGSTKRPTSVVMIMPRAGKKEGGGEEGEGEWEEAYADLLKVAKKLGQTVKV